MEDAIAAAAGKLLTYRPRPDGNEAWAQTETEALMINGALRNWLGALAVIFIVAAACAAVALVTTTLVMVGLWWFDGTNKPLLDVLLSLDFLYLVLLKAMVFCVALGVAGYANALAHTWPWMGDWATGIVAAYFLISVPMIALYGLSTHRQNQLAFILAAFLLGGLWPLFKRWHALFTPETKW
jgi:ABC-type spermidine/putrescine transport system permease subunit II